MDRPKKKSIIQTKNNKFNRFATFNYTNRIFNNKLAFSPYLSLLLSHLYTCLNLKLSVPLLPLRICLLTTATTIHADLFLLIGDLKLLIFKFVTALRLSKTKSKFAQSDRSQKLYWRNLFSNWNIY